MRERLKYRRHARIRGHPDGKYKRYGLNGGKADGGRNASLRYDLQEFIDEVRLGTFPTDAKGKPKKPDASEEGKLYPSHLSRMLTTIDIDEHESEIDGIDGNETEPPTLKDTRTKF